MLTLPSVVLHCEPLTCYSRGEGGVAGVGCLLPSTCTLLFLHALLLFFLLHELSLKSRQDTTDYGPLILSEDRSRSGLLVSSLEQVYGSLRLARERVGWPSLGRGNANPFMHPCLLKGLQRGGYWSRTAQTQQCASRVEARGFHYHTSRNGTMKFLL